MPTGCLPQRLPPPPRCSFRRTRWPDTIHKGSPQRSVRCAAQFNEFLSFIAPHGSATSDKTLFVRRCFENGKCTMNCCVTLLSFCALLTTFWASDPAQQPTPAVPSGTNRFQIAVHNFVRDGQEVEVLIRLDRHTGKTWQFNAGQHRAWKGIPDDNDGPKPTAGDLPKYELVCHNFSKAGKEYEVYIRFDQQTGRSWQWKGAEPAWKIIEEEQ